MSILGDEAETPKNDANVDGNIYNGLLSGQWHQSAKYPFPLTQLPHYGSDASAHGTVSEQILRIRSEVIYS